MAADKFGHYYLETRIGRGGTGEVYRAFDTQRNQYVALKRLAPHLKEDDEFRARFQRESELLAQLKNPHIIPIYDFDEIDGQLFITMLLVDGIDLRALLAKHGWLTPRRAVDIVVQVASALDAAHAARVVHRDVTPSNVLLATLTNNDDHAYLIDFGIAHASAASNLTSTGMIIGTAAYMAPERFQSRNWDHRVDVYSLACVLYELLTGGPPFDSDGQPTVQRHAHLYRSATPPSAVKDGIPTGLDQVVARGMAKDPNQRYGSAGALADASRAALSAATSWSTGPTRGINADDTASTQQAAPTSPRQRRTRLLLEDPNPHRLPKRSVLITGVVVVATALLLFVACAKLLDGWSAANDPVPIHVTSIPVDGNPVGVAITPDGRELYVTNYFWSRQDSVTVIDAGSKEYRCDTAVDNNPVSVAISPDGTRSYITNKDSGTVSVIDIRNHTVIKTITVENSPEGVAVTPDGTHAYITNSGSNTVSVIDTQKNTVARTIRVGSGPWGVAISPDGTRAYITNKESGTVSIVNTENNTVFDTIAVLRGPEGVAITPDGTRAYIADSDSGMVSVVKTGNNTIDATVIVGDNPRGVAISPDGTRAYITNAGSGIVSVIDTHDNSLHDPITVEGNPQNVTVSPEGRHVYVANYDSKTVSVIDIGKG